MLTAAFHLVWLSLTFIGKKNGQKLKMLHYSEFCRSHVTKKVNNDVFFSHLALKRPRRAPLRLAQAAPLIQSVRVKPWKTSHCWTRCVWTVVTWWRTAFCDSCPPLAGVAQGRDARKWDTIVRPVNPPKTLAMTLLLQGQNKTTSQCQWVRGDVRYAHRFSTNNKHFRDGDWGELWSKSDWKKGFQEEWSLCVGPTQTKQIQQQKTKKHFRFERFYCVGHFLNFSSSFTSVKAC